MNKNERNVGTPERITRIVGGIIVGLTGLYVLLNGSSLWLSALAFAGIALGLDFIYTGITGYCPLYAKLRWSTARAQSAMYAPANPLATRPTKSDSGGSARVVLPVLDLACAGGDALVVERVIAKMPGVLSAYVNPATENAYVDYDPERVTSAAIEAKVRELGYRTEPSVR